MLFGRLQEFDERSRNFRLTTTYREPRSYTWSCDQTLDQGSVGACVGLGWAHELIARPVKVKGIDLSVAMRIYKRAQDLDQWPGNDYEGTSVLAGAKAVMETGHIQKYEWAFNLNEVLVGISYHGPAVLGINWYSAMNTPDKEGIIRPKGMLQGGHCILGIGYNKRTDLVCLHNSWGPEWGLNGRCYISSSNLWLLLDQGGECCLPIGRKK